MVDATIGHRGQPGRHLDGGDRDALSEGHLVLRVVLHVGTGQVPGRLTGLFDAGGRTKAEIGHVLVEGVLVHEPRQQGGTHIGRVVDDPPGGHVLGVGVQVGIADHAAARLHPGGNLHLRVG